MIAELARRQRFLAWYGLACLAGSILTALLQVADPRLIAGVPIWAKPTKFFLSIGVFALTAAFYYGDVAAEWRHRPLLRAAAWVLISAGSFELIYISLRAARGEASHFNVATAEAAALYAMMGVGAVLLVGTVLPLAWMIARRPAPGLDPFQRRAVVAGLLLTFLLGGVLGGYMSAQPSHAVGLEGGHFPLFGWNRSGGDLRVAHFLGIHAEQIVPLSASMIARALPRWRSAALAAVVLAFAGVTIALFVQATTGHALL